jgi:hypothetical protein
MISLEEIYYKQYLELLNKPVRSEEDILQVTWLNSVTALRTKNEFEMHVPVSRETLRSNTFEFVVMALYEICFELNGPNYSSGILLPSRRKVALSEVVQNRKLYEGYINKQSDLQNLTERTNLIIEPSKCIESLERVVTQKQAEIQKLAGKRLSLNLTNGAVERIRIANAFTKHYQLGLYDRS